MQRLLLIVAGVLVAVAGLRHVGGFLTPVLFGAMVAGASAPLVTYLTRRRVPVVLSALAVLVIDFAVLAAVAALFFSAATDLQERLPLYAEKLLTLTNRATRNFGAANAQLRDVLNHERIAAAVSSVAERLVALGSFGAMVLFVVFFTLCEGAGLDQKLRLLIPHVGTRLDRLEKVMSDVRSYLLVKSFTSLVAALGTFIILHSFDLPLATLLSLSMFLLHYIPNVGAVVGTAACVAVALVERNVSTALGVGASIAAVTALVGNVLEPHFLGRALRLSPLVLLLGMLFWGWLWGPAGAVLSVPIVVVTKAALENTDNFGWVAQLLGNGPVARRRLAVIKTVSPRQNAS